MDEQSKVNVGFPEANEESLGAYQKGYEDGARELARRLENYYRSLGGHTTGYLVEYTIERKLSDLLKEGEADG
jgi:hypothetical protein